ncbi:MAG: glycosyltransferase family 39 protein [Bacilli bacterium]|nr:glycosyltransferase family 39 protein [Bacilli bacterium]
MHMTFEDKAQNKKEKMSFGEYLFKGKLAPLIWGVAILVTLYGLYFAFSFTTKPYEGSADQLYWTEPRHVWLRIVLAANAIGCLILLLVLRSSKKLNDGLAALLIGGMASSVILSYSFGAPIYGYGMTFNQHDLYYDGVTYVNGKFFDYGSGHHGVIMTIFKMGKIPSLIPDNAGGYKLDFSSLLERYQPKGFYIISAWFMRFNSLFINLGDAPYKPSSMFSMTDWALFESLRILYAYIQIIQLYFFYKIFKALKMKGLPLLVSFSLLSFMPIWCYFAHWANNDGMCFFFAVLAIYFTITFEQKEDWLSVVMIALFIGLSMACKLGGALAAIMIAPVLVYVLVRSVKKGTWKKTVLQAVTFALIVFPIGLFWPVYNLVLYGQPLAFFSEVPNDVIRIHNESIFERFILFPNSDVFNMIWVYHGYGHPVYRQDTSLITALIKTTLYGEYGFGRSAIQMGVIYVITILLFFAFWAGVIALVVFAVKRRKSLDWKRTVLFALIFVVSYGWAVYFVQAHPFTCNEDIRYIPFILIPMCGVFGMFLEGIEAITKDGSKVRKGFNYGVSIATALFALGVLVAYISVSQWYYRVS